MKNSFLFLAIALCLVACHGTKSLTGNNTLRLNFIGEYLLPDSTFFNGTKVGGLSGIDYDAASDSYYLISDDRSDYNPARFYTAKFSVSTKGIDSFRFLTTMALRRQNGQVYPNKKHDSVHVPDPEGLRLNPKNNTLVWVSEGERILRAGAAILQDPSITVMTKEGQWQSEFLLPANLHMSAAEKGPRRNGVFEGLTFAEDFRKLYVSVEEPLYEDGSRAGLNDSTAWVRLCCFDAQTQKPLAQYAYRLDAVSKAPVPAGSFMVNGIVDVLALDDAHLLVTERSFSAGYIGCNVRVYLVDLRGATDVTNNPSLLLTPPQTPLQKKLVFNMDNLGREVYNIEGATFGSRLPNGKRSLVFVSDDNFSGREKTQFLLFEVE